jgi:hypothetical protein
MSSPLFGVTVQVLYQFSGIYAQSTFFAIHKMGDRTAVGDSVGRCHERKSWHENLVTRRYPSQFEGDMQGGGSVNDCHRMLGASVAGKVDFESIYKLAHRRDKSGIEALFDIFPLVSMESRLMQRIGFGCIRENFAQCTNHLVCQGAIY